MPNPRTLPTIRTTGDLLPYLKRWEHGLGPLLKRVDTMPAPWRFRVTNQRGGNLLEWEPVTGADGYELLKSADADFDSGIETISIPSELSNSYFDGLSGSGASVTVKRFYKLRATSGTTQNPHSVKGLLTGIVSATSIDPADTATASSVVEDTTTDDGTQRGKVDDFVVY